ncbi:MAG TPA: glucose 1-dehydrogenase [Deltaproteobacteria bacterium]|nr:glucose 1-dehydrogenase [Deltaproteobacteria bacterium]
MTDLSRFSLEGKVAVVTGGSRGIGRAAAIGLAKAGADVVVTSRKLPDLENVAEEVRTTGRKATPIAAHIGKMDNILMLVEKVMDEFGRIDILVNNAGCSPAMGSIFDNEERLWDTIINLNLKGLYFMSQAVAKIMKEQGKGSIINVASMDGYKPEPFVGIYSISKAGVIMATKSMALELAPYNIRANAVAPGPISTKMLDSHWFHLPEEQAKAEKAELAKNVPLKRVGDPDEIAGAIIYLASEASSFTTGETILVDGGCTIASPEFTIPE